MVRSNSGHWKMIFRINLRTLNIGLMMYGKARWQDIDPTLQDNVLIPNNFVEYIYHIGCAVNSHSITNSGLIAGGQNSSRDRQTLFFTAANPMNQNFFDPQELDLTKPSSCIVREEVEKAPRYGVLGRYTACSTERIEVLSNKIVTQSSSTIHSQHILSRKQLWWNLKKSYTRRYYVSPRPPPKIFYKR